MSTKNYFLSALTKAAISKKLKTFLCDVIFPPRPVWPEWDIFELLANKFSYKSSPNILVPFVMF